MCSPAPLETNGEKPDVKLKKDPIDPTRIRTVPCGGFSWIDRRFVREGFIDRLSGEAVLLYFFLAAASDAKGLSFYADPTTKKLLKLDPEQINHGRAELLKAGLILYRYPLYQVLPLPEGAQSTFQPRVLPEPRGGEPTLLSELLKRLQPRAEDCDANKQP